jgi:hypothetical protein
LMAMSMKAVFSRFCISCDMIEPSQKRDFLSAGTSTTSRAELLSHASRTRQGCSRDEGSYQIHQHQLRTGPLRINAKALADSDTDDDDFIPSNTSSSSSDEDQEDSIFSCRHCQRLPRHTVMLLCHLHALCF